MSLHFLSKLVASVAFLTCTSVFAAPITIGVDGADSYGVFGDGSNAVLNLFVGAGATITGISYNVNLTAYNPSFLSEITLAVTDSAVSGVAFSPAADDDLSGTGNYSGTVNFSAFAVGADGLLRIEFFEQFDDASIAPDGRWNSGTITFDVTPAVPEPASILLMGAGLAMMAYAGRRRARASSATIR